MQNEQDTQRDFEKNFLKIVENLILNRRMESVNYTSGQGTGDISMAGPQDTKEAGVKGFAETCRKMIEVNISKSHDYAGDVNPLSNFDTSEYGLSLFKNPRDQAFVWPIFTKLARLATLLNSGNTPKNESIEDSLIDIANYVVLWKCDIALRKDKIPTRRHDGMGIQHNVKSDK